jgi:hypothetical protein
MVKPPARPLIRCVPLLLAAAALGAGSAALPGVALATTRAAALPSPVAPLILGPIVPGTVALPALPSVVEDAAAPPLSGWPQLQVPLPVVGWVAGQPWDPGDDSDDPGGGQAPDDDEQEEPAPAPPVEPALPAVPAIPAPAVPPAAPTVAPAPKPTTAPRATWSPRPAPSSRRPTPADTRGLDDLFPDHTPSNGAAPGSDEDGDRTNNAGAAGYARPLIWSGIAGMLVSGIGIGFVLNRRRGW